jgi:alkylhydroperoxidase family enzyme
MDINSAVGRQRGLSDDKLLDLGRYEHSAAYSELERLVLRLTDAMSAAPANVSAELFGQLRAHFSEEQLVELSSAIAWENYRARFNRVFDVGSQGFAAGHVCVLPATRP